MSKELEPCPRGCGGSVFFDANGNMRHFAGPCVLAGKRSQSAWIEQDGRKVLDETKKLTRAKALFLSLECMFPSVSSGDFPSYWVMRRENGLLTVYALSKWPRPPTRDLGQGSGRLTLLGKVFAEKAQLAIEIAREKYGSAESAVDIGKTAKLRALHALELRRKGLSFSEIGKAIGTKNDPNCPVTPSRASELVRRGERIERRSQRGDEE